MTRRGVIVASYSGDFAAELHRQISPDREFGVVRRNLSGHEMGERNRAPTRHDPKRRPIRNLGGWDADRPRRRYDHHRRSAQRFRGPIGARARGSSSGTGARSSQVATIRTPARSSRSCSACTRTTWPVTSCARAIGTIWNCRRWRWTSKPSNSGMEGPICASNRRCAASGTRGAGAPSTP
jgi:hypothetical protein